MPHSHHAFCKPALLAVSLALALLATDAEAQRRQAAPKPPVVSLECTDFYSATNAPWLAANPQVGGAGPVSALGQLREASLRQQREMLDAAMQSPQGGVQALLGDFWASGLDEAAVERDGTRSIAPLLDRINSIRRARDVAPAIAALHQAGIPVAFDFSADIDLQDRDRHIGYFSQGGLGLPDPAYYTRGDAPTRELLGRYREYVKQILALTGTSAAQLDAEADAVIELETRIAAVQRPVHELRIPMANYAPVPTAGLRGQYRNLHLEAFLKAQGVADNTVSIANPALFAELDNLVARLPPAQWRTYLRWQLGDAMAPYLGRSFREAEFEFRGRVLRGETTPPERWRHVLHAMNITAGPLIGREYATRHLPEASRDRAADIAAQVAQALGRGIERNQWMSQAAKTEARGKLDQLRIEVGTPGRDIDPSVQPMDRGSFGGNVLAASTWRHREEMKRIGTGGTARRWEVPPQQPALAYDLQQNRLIVTAAVLQPPVFDADGGDPALFGAYGALVGHELSRGFDRIGRMTDAGGEARDWWGAQDLQGWDALGRQVALQYGGYALPGNVAARVDGVLTLDKNMADMAGLELAWDAYVSARPESAVEDRQGLFRAWAGLWAQQPATGSAAADVYAPGQWRTNGPLANLPAFGEAFKCKAGDPMQRTEAEQIRIWR